MEKETFEGLGNLVVPTDASEIELKGIWKDSKLLIDRDSLPPSTKRETLRKLREGIHSLTYASGITLEGEWKDFILQKGTVKTPDGKVEEYDPAKHDYLNLEKKEAYASKLVLFDWNKFVYKILGTHKINLKILFSQQQDFLKPLIDYGMIRLVHEQEYRKDDRALTHYNEFPRVDLHIRKGEFNIDHLLRSEFPEAFEPIIMVI